MKEFLDYLEKNLMCYTVVDEGIVEIGGSTFELYKPAYDGALFDEDFNFVGIPASDRGGESVGTECDYYAYRFGGVYYMLPRGKENDVKLIRLKYVGQAAQEIPTEVFLGVHGQYEITSGSGPYSEWCRKAKFLGVHTLGICEKNSLAGALKFQEECQKNGLKSVIGMECTVSDEPNDYRFTVKVYARNEKGWRDLLTINKFINCDNPKYISLSDFNAVTRNNDDLVLFLDPKTLDYSRLKGLGLDAVIYQLDPVEYTDNSRDEKYLKNLKAFFKDRNLVPVASIDAWYLDEEYSCIRPRLQSIGGTTAYDSDNQYFKANDQYFLELASMFPDTEQGFEDAYSRFTDAVDLLKDIADAIDFTIDVKTRHLPRYKMTPEEASQFETNEDLFWSLIEKGLEAHPDLLEDWGDDVIAERIDREVGVIKLGEAIDYFLITWDIINWCHCNGIMTGISRGSAGGCLVSYLLGITKLDPMKYDLLFERFLNAGRVKVSLPDIDCDYPGEDRPRVKKYMEERYGWKQVCSVGTYSALQLRAAIKDMARVYGLNFQETNEMMKVFDVKDRKPEDLFKIACAHSRVKEFVKAHPDLINEVMLIMPAPKAQSIHACAMMVFPDEHDMFRWVPIRKQGEDYVTEWEGGEMDAAGFLKEDVLGVKQFDKFQDMVRLIRENEDVDLDIFSVPLDDAEVYRYFQNGWNEDNFHFGSSGLTGYCKQMKPENIEDLIAAISLYRPGAMENNFHNEYVSRKEGNQNVEYFVGTEAVLQNTYGVFCIAEDSEVLTERGLVKIQDIIPGKDRVKTEDGSYQTVYLKKDNGMREVVRVVSNFGREVVCTPNHKLLTKRGWVEAQNLVKNDELCCWFEQPARIDNLTEKENLEHWLIGFFLAEGTCGSTPYFSVSNKRVAEKIKNLLLELLSDVTVDIKEYPHKHKSGRIGVSTRVSVKSRHGNNGYFNKDYKPNPFIQLLKKWGIWGQTCYTKRLPVNYSLSMLAGLLEGDGCLTNYTLRMCNKELLKDVYMGLQSYGVHSSFFHQKDAMAVSWNDINHILPLRLFDTKKLKRKSSTNYGWGRVKRVVELELPKRVYDLSVENIHSFTVSGCVVANCYQEQIMQLCRELGGLSLVEADDVRKAMVKKKYEALQQYKERFIPYYRDNYGVSQKYSEKVWDAIDKASTYLFNRCISGNERIKRHSRTNGAWHPTIAEMYRVKHDRKWAFDNGHGALHDKYKYKGYGSSWSLNEKGGLVLNEIKDIYFQGIRETLTIKLENGSKITVTGNHKFPLPDGRQVKAENLRVGDELYLYDKNVNDWVGGNFTDQFGYLPYTPSSKVEKFVLNSKKGHEGFTTKGETNWKKWDKYRRELKKNYCENCGKIHRRLEVHHKDGDHANNKIDNLMTVCPSCHKKFHYEMGRTVMGRKGIKTKVERIASIIKNPPEEVYDVEMEDPYHTFTTEEGIVTCNSHAAAYAITGYISQWIKVHYPIEYWSVAFKYATDEDYPRYIAEINKTRVCTVKPVDINISDIDVVIDFKNKSLYWSITGVKQVAEKAATQILKERKENGQYWSLEDFITRHKWKGSAVNTRVIQNLILSGAFDSIEGITTPQERVNLLVEYLGSIKSKIEEDNEILVGADRHANDSWWWALLQKKLSGLAFFDYDAIYRRYGEGNFATNYEYVSFEECLDTDNRPNNGYVIVAGYVTEMEIKKTRKGEVMCKLILESNYEFLEVMIFQTEYKQLESLLTGKANLMIISGSLTWDNRKEQNILRANYETNIVSLTL